MNLYQYRDILILTTLLTNFATLLASEPIQSQHTQPRYSKLEFFKNRKPSIELNDLVAIIQATDSFKDAAQALDATKKRVHEKINSTLAPSWLTTLDQAYSHHVGSCITFEFEQKQTTITDLFELYKTLEQEIIALHKEMPNLDDEHKSDHLDAMLEIIKRGKTIEEFLANALDPQTAIARTWTEIHKSIQPTIATTTKSLDSYNIYKAAPGVREAFDALLENLRLTKTLKAAQKSLSSTTTWLAQRLADGDISPAESLAWTIELNTTYNDQTTKRLPQLQISQMYAKSKLALKTLKGYQTA